MSGTGSSPGGRAIAVKSVRVSVNSSTLALKLTLRMADGRNSVGHFDFNPIFVYCVILPGIETKLFLL